MRPEPSIGIVFLPMSHHQHPQRAIAEPVAVPRDGAALDRSLDAFQPIRVPKASDEVLAVLVDAIRGGLYEPGDLLPRERDLSDRLEVSRTVLRAAIDVLRQAGVVSVRRGNAGGIVVESTANLAQVLAGIQGGTRADLRSVLEARRPLELAGSLLAAGRMTDDRAAELQRLVAMLEPLLDQPAEFYETDIRFHLRVGELSGNEMIAQFVRSTFGRLAVIRSQFPVAHVELRAALANQRRLLRAITGGDEADIAAAVDEHLTAFEEVMLGERLRFFEPAMGLSEDVLGEGRELDVVPERPGTD
jgi:GntR family transcriptional regulator, transcriptional repressor for pyruvate dehydrogenase complex